MNMHMNMKHEHEHEHGHKRTVASATKEDSTRKSEGRCGSYDLLPRVLSCPLFSV